MKPGPNIVNPGWRPSGDGWTADLLHRCTRCGRESRHPTTLDRMHWVCDCGECRREVGLEHSMKRVVDPRLFRPVSLN